MKRRLAAGALTFTVSAGACACSGASPSAVLTSPNGRYVVQLHGSRGRAYVPFDEHVVRADVVKDGSQYIKRRAIHSADWFDTAFHVDYVGAEWVAENALRFKWSVAERYAGADRVVVVNKAEVAVSFLRVQAGDLFVLLDLPPAAEIKLQTTPQRGHADHSWISLDGEFADGTAIPDQGVNFVLSGPRELRHQYRIVISEGAVDLTEVAHNARVYGEHGR